MNATQLKDAFLQKLREEERSRATLEKYERDIRHFIEYLCDPLRAEDFTSEPQHEPFRADFASELQREPILQYKEMLKQIYAPASVNSMLVALNRFLTFIGRSDLRVSLLRTQRRIFRDEKKELTKDEYIRLLREAKAHGDQRLFLLMETICSTGIRVSEHRFITVESLQAGYAEIDNKGRTRTVLLEKRLCKELRRYCRKAGIKSGPVFRTRSGKALNRTNIWRMMKRLAEGAGVLAEKIFPHNLRHLFAVTFYRVTGDIVRLADLLGHACIDTTRIYTSISMDSHRATLSRMKLLIS